jgi:hypothetical protein
VERLLDDQAIGLRDRGFHCRCDQVPDRGDRDRSSGARLGRHRRSQQGPPGTHRWVLGQAPTAQPNVPVYCSDARQACFTGVDLLTDIEGPLIAQGYRCGPGIPPRNVNCLKEEGNGKPTYRLDVQAVGRGVASLDATVSLITPGARAPVDQARPLLTWMAQLPFKHAPARAELARQWVIGHLPTSTTSRPSYQSINHYSYLCSGVGVDTGEFQSWTIDCAVTANYVP